MPPHLGGLVRRCCGAGLAAGAALLGLRTRRPVGGPVGLGRGVALTGTVWTGHGAPFAGVVIVGPDGRVAALGRDLHIPEGCRLLRGGWVGPGVVDAHVHLAFGGPDAELAGGLVAVRALGAPPVDARRWRGIGAPAVGVCGPVLTADGGYPSTSWGAAGFAAFLGEPRQIAAVVRDLAADGVDLLKVALEPSGGLPVPSPAQLRALVDAAHSSGLLVTAHALELAMVQRALDGGVDELAHTPVEVLPPALVDRIADAGIPVVSTLQTFYAGGEGRGPGINAANLHAAGVPLLYGTDLGNAGTRPGVDPRELDRLADAGLGRAGALVAATAGSARAAGLAGRAGDGTVTVGAEARLVLLDHDPLIEPAAWRSPLAVLADGRLVEP
jgi:imidazolonepropionase-like amidohydrolase